MGDIYYLRIGDIYYLWIGDIYYLMHFLVSLFSRMS